MNVFEVLKERIRFIFDHFEEIYLSFSGGKDSSVTMHLVASECRKRKRKSGLLIIDLEGQYKATIDHIQEMIKKYDDCFEVYWVALPLHLRNAVSVFEPQWVCWDKEKKDLWVREQPKEAITDYNYFPFFKYAMEFEDFTPAFADWYSRRKGGRARLTCTIVCIRTQESLRRWKAVYKDEQCKFLKKRFLNTQLQRHLVNAYPIYDWHTEDIWRAVGRNNWEYNKIYDQIYQTGKSIHEARICQPYGDDQRQGLDLFRKCEPEVWQKIVRRVSGANYGNIYCNTFLLGNKKVILSKSMTWRKFYEFLLNTIPKWQAEWYKFRVGNYMKNWDEKFETYMSENIYKYKGKNQQMIKDFADRWRKDINIPIQDRIKDEENPKIESFQLAPSYRRIAKCVYKNDLVMFGLGMSRVKDLYYILSEFKQKHGE